jgi:anti-sigma regulatory factor (Ser/Thr protein kinase)
VSGATSLAGAVHEAVLYSSVDDLAERLAPRIRSSLDDEAPVVAVLDAPTRAAVRRRLAAAADRVEFPDPATVHRLPPFTVALRWARVSRGAGAGHATVVGQHLGDLLGCDETHWARLDIALNVAVVGLPIAVLCPYRADGDTVDRVRATHPLLGTPDGPVASASYRQPADVVGLFPPPPPPDLGPPTAALPFGAAELGAVRGLVAEVGARTDDPPDRVADLVLAVNEIASNSVEHGPGGGVLRLWAGPAGLTAEIVDTGLCDVPFPGLSAPPLDGLRGRGLWLAGELCDVLQVWSDRAGTVVRLRMERG